MDTLVPSDDFGQVAIRSHHVGSWESDQIVKSYKVSAIRLDEHVKDRRLQGLDFAKCDIKEKGIYANGLISTK